MINTVALMGRLTYEPEIKTTPSGVSVIRFQIACDRNYQSSGQERQADFIDCVAWRQRAEFISRYFHKGSMIAIEGSIQTQNYTDKNGNNRKSVEVVANNVSFCGSKSNTSISEAPTEKVDEKVADLPPRYNPPSNDYSDFEEIIDDDIPLPF